MLGCWIGLQLVLALAALGLRRCSEYSKFRVRVIKVTTVFGIL